MQKRTIRVAVVGLGNLGRACVEQIKQRGKEFELTAVFSRRPIPNTMPMDQIEQYKNKVDVVLICVGSNNDAPAIVPRIAKNFNIVDSYDTHNNLENYITSIKTKKVAIVATGWDPGLLSIIRLYLTALIPDATLQTFWGPGVSMGHTNAIKQIEGVKAAYQETVPLISQGVHKRVCYITADKADQARIEQQIRKLPNYFAGQNVEVNFVTKVPNRTRHTGQVICTDKTSHAHFKVSLKSNPKFTAQIMLAYAKANYNLQINNKSGVFNVADIAPKYLFDNKRLDLI